jgi:adenine-specific DNA-methyltransferase
MPTQTWTLRLRKFFHYLSYKNIMNKEALNFLKEYSFEPYTVNRLIVSSFLKEKKKVIKNCFLQKYIVKPSDEDFEVFSKFSDLTQIDSLEKLIAAFEFVISPADKVITGAVYTPKHIREYIVNNCLSTYTDLSNLSIADISCGCGGFLITAAEYLQQKTKKSFKTIIEENLWGLDIAEYSVDRAKIILILLAIDNNEDENIAFNLFVGNALNFAWKDIKEVRENEGFDVIIGNPPYVASRNIDDESKRFLEKWEVNKTGHPDLYISFFEIGLQFLKEKGILGYITVNTFFKSVNGRALRAFFSKGNYDFNIIDFRGEKIFIKKNAYTCICIIKKAESAYLKYKAVSMLNLLNSSKTSFDSIKYSDLDSKRGWNLCNRTILSKIENTGTPFGKLFKTRNGIATLKNNVYIFKPDREDKKYYYLNNGSIHKIEKGICKEVINSNILTNIQSIKGYTEKIIFPYVHVDKVAELIKESDFKKKFPYAYSYLLSQKELLSKRDKGSGRYTAWYAFGRNQSLEQFKYKLLFPHIASDIPNYVINSNPDLLFVNGMAIVSNKRKPLLLMQKILSSRLFWFYILNSSKPYGSNYFSLSRNYIKNFGIYNFSSEDISFLLREKNQQRIDEFVELKYDVRI